MLCFPEFRSFAARNRVLSLESAIVIAMRQQLCLREQAMPEKMFQSQQFSTPAAAIPLSINT
eukprot:2286533-Amphidinium_carterae.1